MKVAIIYRDNYSGLTNTEVFPYNAAVSASFWDDAKDGIIEILDYQMSYDNGETWESVF